MDAYVRIENIVEQLTADLTDRQFITTNPLNGEVVRYAKKSDPWEFTVGVKQVKIEPEPDFTHIHLLIGYNIQSPMQAESSFLLGNGTRDFFRDVSYHCFIQGGQLTERRANHIYDIGFSKSTTTPQIMKDVLSGAIDYFCNSVATNMRVDTMKSQNYLGNIGKIEQKILTPQSLKELAPQIKKQGTVALCSGCYDLAHAGHPIFFSQAKSIADVLVVSIGSDATIRALKGPQRPFIPQSNRIFLIAAMQDVDYVIVGSDTMLPGKIDFFETLQTLKPDYFVLNDDDSGIEAKQQLCAQYGTKIVLVPRVVPESIAPLSSTKIQQTVAQRANAK